MASFKIQRVQNWNHRAKGALLQSLFKLEFGSGEQTHCWQHLLKVDAPFWWGYFGRLQFFPGLAIVTNWKNCISQSKTVLEWPLQSQLVAGAQSPRARADGFFPTTHPQVRDISTNIVRVWWAGHWPHVCQHVSCSTEIPRKLLPSPGFAAIPPLCLPGCVMACKGAILGAGSAAIFPFSPYSGHPWWVPSWKGYFCHFGSLFVLEEFVRFCNFLPSDYLLLFLPFAVSLVNKLLFFSLISTCILFLLIDGKGLVKTKENSFKRVPL